MKALSASRTRLGAVVAWAVVCVAPAAEFTLGPVQRATDLDLAGSESAPTFGPDSLSVLFVSDAGDAQIYYADRPTTHDEFTNRRPDTDLSSPTDDEADPYLANDGLELFLVRWPNGQPQLADLYRSTRACSTCRWNPPEPLVQLNSGLADRAPVLTRDGLTLYFASDRPGSRGFDVWVATRDALGSPFNAPASLDQTSPGVNSVGDDLPVSVSPDVFDLVIQSDVNRPGAGDFDLFVAHRLAEAANFSPAIAFNRPDPPDLTSVNTSFEETFGRFTPDGREVYLTSSRVADGTTAIYKATVTASSQDEGVLRCFDRPGDIAPATVLADSTIVSQPDGAVTIGDVVLLLRAVVGLNRFPWQPPTLETVPPPAASNRATFEIGTASTMAFTRYQVVVHPRASFVGYEFVSEQPGALVDAPAAGWSTRVEPKASAGPGRFETRVNGFATLPATGPGYLSRVTTTFTSASRPTCNDVDVTVTLVDMLGNEMPVEATCSVQSYGTQ